LTAGQLADAATVVDITVREALAAHRRSLLDVAGNAVSWFAPRYLPAGPRTLGLLDLHVTVDQTRTRHPRGLRTAAAPTTAVVDPRAGWDHPTAA